MTEFIEVKTSDLTGEALNWAVTLSQGFTPYKLRGGKYGQPDSLWFVCGGHGAFRYNWVGNWALTGPLLSKYLIGFQVYSDAYMAVVGALELSGAEYGPTHLVAACRAVVFAKLGSLVLVPVELVTP